MLTKLLNRFGLYTRTQVAERDRLIASFRQAAEPFVLFAIEARPNPSDTLVTWDSKQYGCVTEIFMRDIDQFGPCVYPDFQFKRLGISEDAPVYREWRARNVA